MSRKIVQIAAIPDTMDRGTMFALCEDGTLWERWYSDNQGCWLWDRLPTVPDDEPETVAAAEERTS